MKLLLLIDSKISFEEEFKKELLRMDCFFQNHLWDGCADENDPKFITPADFEAIEALTDKIKHMVLNIGCPNSVLPMLQSIVTRRIKRWQGNDALETKDHTVWVCGTDSVRGKNKTVVKGFKKGKQLKSKDQLARVAKSVEYYGDKGTILVGHFRWNNRGYLLSRRATELLSKYLLKNYSEMFV